jgi:uncharacterized protein (TIGR02145 family)
MAVQITEYLLGNIKGPPGATGADGLSLHVTTEKINTTVGNATVIGSIIADGREVQTGDIVMSMHSESMGYWGTIGINNNGTLSVVTIGSLRGAKGENGDTGPDGEQGPRGFSIVGMRLDGEGDLYYSLEIDDQIAIKEYLLGNIKGPPGPVVSTANHLVYLGQLAAEEPTPQQLSDFAAGAATALFGEGELKTGYTVRDAQDRDWRWVDDGVQLKVIKVGTQSEPAISGNVTVITFAVNTKKINNGTYMPVLSSAIAGVSLSSITIRNNSGTLTVNVANTAAVGVNTRTISFDGIDGINSNSFTITISVGEISFTQQPSNATVTEGSISGTLSATAASTSAASSVSYKWYSNTTNSNSGGTVINGATANIFTIPTSLTAGSYYYYCKANGTKGEVETTSSVATVVVTAQQADNRMYDEKDGTYYETIQVGNLLWTIENYRYNGNGLYYNNAQSEPFEGAGKHYTYQEAVANAPQGWRLPTRAEAESLQTAAGSGNGLKATREWQTANGTDTINFALLPVGGRNATAWANLNASAYMWSSVPGRIYIHYNGSSLLFDTEGVNDNYYLSVRYVKEAS